MTGSSGAPLIDAASRRAVAVLTGGFATCSAARGAADFFGRLSSVVRPWRSTIRFPKGRRTQWRSTMQRPGVLRQSSHSKSMYCCLA